MSVTKIRLGVALLVLTIAASIAEMPRAHAVSDTDYAYGTVGGLAYTGRSYMSWTTGNGGIVYQGNGSTWIDNHTNVDQIAADNYGNTWCGGFFIIDEDWSNQDTEQNDWYAYAAGSGWAMVGECSTLGVVVESFTVHPVWYDPDFDMVDSSAWDATPF